jgi:hypothetical protein
MSTVADTVTAEPSMTRLSQQSTTSDADTKSRRSEDASDDSDKRVRQRGAEASRGDGKNNKTSVAAKKTRPEDSSDERDAPSPPRRKHRRKETAPKRTGVAAPDPYRAPACGGEDNRELRANAETLPPAMLRALRLLDFSTVREPNPRDYYLAAGALHCLYTANSDPDTAGGGGGNEGANPQAAAPAQPTSHRIVYAEAKDNDHVRVFCRFCGRGFALANFTRAAGAATSGAFKDYRRFAQHLRDCGLPAYWPWLHTQHLPWFDACHRLLDAWIRARAHGSEETMATVVASAFQQQLGDELNRRIALLPPEEHLRSVRHAAVQMYWHNAPVPGEPPFSARQLAATRAARRPVDAVPLPGGMAMLADRVVGDACPSPGLALSELFQRLGVAAVSVGDLCDTAREEAKKARQLNKRVRRRDAQVGLPPLPAGVEPPLVATVEALADERGLTVRELDGDTLAGWADHLAPGDAGLVILDRCTPSFAVVFAVPRVKHTPSQTRLTPDRGAAARLNVIYCGDEPFGFRAHLSQAAAQSVLPLDPNHVVALLLSNDEDPLESRDEAWQNVATGIWAGERFSYGCDDEEIDLETGRTRSQALLLRTVPNVGDAATRGVRLWAVTALRGLISQRQEIVDRTSESARWREAVVAGREQPPAVTDGESQSMDPTPVV